MRVFFLAAALSLVGATAARGESATRPAEGKLPHIQVDVEKKQIRIECEAVIADTPLEFLVCLTGTKEYESLLRSRAKPSHVHLALLMIGLKPGKPARFDEQAGRMLPPEGAPAKLSCLFERNGKTASYPAARLLRNQKTREEMAETAWVFAGSRFTEQGDYLADVSGETISLVNFAHAVLDVPMVRSSRNEVLEWVHNPETSPKRDTKVWLVIEPAEAHAGER